nr:MAG TPA: minor capsid protein [Caudoviricetes sp.]
MLTPKELYNIPDSMVELYSQAEADIIADMARRLSTYDYFIPSAEWQYKKAIEMGLVHDEILKKLSEKTGKSEAEIESLMKKASVKAIKRDDEIYKRAGLSPKPFNSSHALKSILATGLAQTKGTFANLTRTTAVAASRQFEIALDNAYMQIISGAFDSNTSIRNSIEVLAKQGLCSITYASGKVDTIETAVRRAVLTGVNITCGKMQEARADEMGCDLVETTAHEGARPAHALWQGKVFSRSGTHPKYPHFKTATGFGTGAGLCGWNCRHSFFPFFENSSESAYTDEELEGYSEPKYEYNGEMLTHYEASQKQRQIERNIRRWKREELAMEAAGLDSSKAHEKVRTWQAKQRDFIRQTGLKRQYDREQIGKVVDEIGNIKPNVPPKELPLTDKHKEAIEYYVSGDGMYINDYLRNRNNPIERMGEMRKEDRVLIEDLSNATNRKHDNSVLYRSIDATAVFGDISENDWESLQAKLIYNIDDKTTAKAQSLIDKTKGKKIIDKGFMSTTKDYNVAADFGDFTGSDKPIVIEFTNANKVKGFDVEKHLPNLEKRMEQSEVLLHNNSKYTVKDIIVRTDEYGKHIHVIAEFDDIEEIVPNTNTKKDVWKKNFVDGDKSGLKKVNTDDIMKGEPKDNLESTIKGLLDGSSTDREKLGQQILSEFGVDGVDVHVKGMLERGSCSIFVDNGTLKVTDYNLDANDDRSIGYQIKTAFHEGFHAAGNGLPTDYGKMNTSRFSDIEETFAECSSHYMVGQYGITDLAPAYPDELVKMLPRLKQLSEFSSCVTISDFGKVAHDIRPTTGSAWKAMSQAAMRKKFSFSDYTQQYFPEIRKDVGGYVDKILENMPKSKPYRASMIAALEKSMEHVEMHGTTLSDNESLMLNNAIAVCMGKVGVK